MGIVAEVEDSLADRLPEGNRKEVDHTRWEDLDYRIPGMHAALAGHLLSEVDTDRQLVVHTFAVVMLGHSEDLVDSYLAGVHPEVLVEDRHLDMVILVVVQSQMLWAAYHRDDSFVEHLEDILGKGSEDRMEDNQVAPGTVDSVADNLDSVRAADRDPVVVDNLDFVVESAPVAEEHRAFPVDQERVVPDLVQFVQQLMLVVVAEALHDSFQLVGSVEADAPGWLVVEVEAAPPPVMMVVVLEAVEPPLEQLPDSDQAFVPDYRVMDLPRDQIADREQLQMGELRALEDHRHVAVHEGAVAAVECYVGDPLDLLGTPDYGATRRGKTCTHAPCPYSENPE